MPLTETTSTAGSGLAVLFAAIDYHQASNQASPSPTFFNPPKRALKNLKWIEKGNLPIKKRKMNKKTTTDKLNLPSPLSYSVPSSPNSVHTAIVSISSSDHDDSSSIESTLTAPDDLATLEDDSIRNTSVVEACQIMTMGNEATCQVTSSEQAMPTLPIISFDPDQLAALLEQQQQRLDASIQKTEHSRALLHGMRGFKF